MDDLGYCVNAINMKARKLQAVSARLDDMQTIYQLATEITLESQHIREMVQKEIKKCNGNQKQIGKTEIGNTLMRPLLMLLRRLRG